MEQDYSLKSDVLTAKELSEMLKVSRKFVEKHTAAGEIPGQVKVGRVWRYSRIAIQRALRQGGQFLRETESDDRS